MTHRTPDEPALVDVRAQRTGIALILAGIVAVAGSCLNWRTVTSTGANQAALVLQRVSGLHFSRLGDASIGVGDLTLIMGVLAIAVGGLMTWRGAMSLLVSAVTICAALVLAITLGESRTILFKNDPTGFADRPGVGLWLSLAACVAVCAAGLAYLIGTRRER